jgi:hypothetical protein
MKRQHNPDADSELTVISEVTGRMQLCILIYCYTP